jgi:hypothetical protein
MALRAVWERLTPEERRLAAEAFWQSDHEAEQVQAERLLAQRLNFRPKSVHQFSVARKAEYLAALVLPVTPEYLELALISFHLRHRRELMAAFLDALAIPNEHGEITRSEEIAPPDSAALRAARDAVAERFPEHEVAIYLAALHELDPRTWAGLAPLVAPEELGG